MRFAYIDSQGKEVGIPSVEALQLRIELGAITEETIFYDASKDRWDPAGEHEIFRTLSREIRERGEEGPRPPTPRAVTSDESEDRPDPGRGAGSGASSYEAEQDPLADTAPPAEVDWVEVELEDVREPEPGSGEAPDQGGDWDVDLGEFGTLDLAPDLGGGSDQVRSGPPAAAESGPHAAAVDDGEPTDGGSRTDDADAPAPGEAAPDDRGEATLRAAGVSGVGEGSVPGSDPDGRAVAEGELRSELQEVAEGLELERPLAEQDAAPAAASSDTDLELEPPLSRLEPGPRGDWGDMGEEPEAPGSDGSDGEPSAPVGATGAAFTGPSTEGRSPPEAPDTGGEDRAAGMERVREERRRRDPYDRRVQRPRDEGGSRRPKRRLPRRRGGPSPTVLGAAAAALVVLGGLGWFGWTALRDSEAAPAESVRVAIPPLPEGLAPVMRAAADAAWADALDTLRVMAERAELPAEPNPDWLAGVYLANAGDYADVPAYWRALGAHLDRVRAEDESVFVAALRARLDSAAVPAASRDTIVARARSGFRVAAPERQIVYDQLAELVAAATELHGFLVANQEQIAYEPAVGLSSRDPVTEAIPATQALGAEMWERVGEIPAALEALGTLDRVTTERILEVFHRRLAAVGVP